jgi:hypothetical protein
MPQEANDRSPSAPADASASSDLSSHVFSNPDAFIQTLREDFKQISHNSDTLSRSDLQLYAEHGTDPRGKVAAQIAQEHYDELQSMMTKATWYPADNQTVGITDQDLKLDQQLMNSDASGIVHKDTDARTFEMGLQGMFTVGCGALAAVFATADAPE